MPDISGQVVILTVSDADRSEVVLRSAARGDDPPRAAGAVLTMRQVILSDTDFEAPLYWELPRYSAVMR